MQIVKLTGGLGNQLFQYALALAISKETKRQVKLEAEFFKKNDLRNCGIELFNIELEIASKKDLKGLKRYRQYNKTVDNFDANALTSPDNSYLTGYWQSEKYFKNHRTELLKHLSLKAPPSAKSQQYQQQIAQTEAISLHIRRTDYLLDKNAYIGVCSIDYYQKAVAEISKHAKNPHFFIFSDDLEWAKNNLDFITQKTFVQLEKAADSEEMLLMSACQHNIIANSSFSWWGAWLNQNSVKQVIAPENWFDYFNSAKNLVPESWIKITDNEKIKQRNLHFFGYEADKELSTKADLFFEGKLIELTAINEFYQNLDLKKPFANLVIKRYCRDNIGSIKFSWNADIKILLYYFRYKLAAFFKK